MKYIIIVFGVLIVLSGLMSLINPDPMFDYLEENLDEFSMYIFAILFRLIMGSILLKTANESALHDLFMPWAFDMWENMWRCCWPLILKALKRW